MSPPNFGKKPAISRMLHYFTSITSLGSFYCMITLLKRCLYLNRRNPKSHAFLSKGCRYSHGWFFGAKQRSWNYSFSYMFASDSHFVRSSFPTRVVINTFFFFFLNSYPGGWSDFKTEDFLAGYSPTFAEGSIAYRVFELINQNVLSGLWY